MSLELLGRAAEVDALRAVVDAARCGGSVLVLVGDPGIGKSMLLAATRAASRDAGYNVLRASGLESEMHLPFGGLHQIVGPLLGRLDELPGPQRDGLRSALGLTGRDRPDLFLIAEATCSLLMLARRTCPLMILVDDVQWLDPQSNQILAFIGHRSREGRLGLIGVTRPDHSGPFADAGFPALRVRGVDDGTADALLERSPTPLTPLEARRIRDEAGGNPLALVELPRAWGGGPQTDEHPLALSARLEREFAGRVSSLPVRTQDALLLAAVGSSSKTDEILRALSRLTSLDVSEEVFEPALAVNLISEVAPTVVFRHPLVRSGVLQREPLARRQAAHLSLAEVLVTDTYRSAWHRSWSLVGPDDDIAADLAATVDESLRRGAVMSAVASLERAAQLTSAPVERGERLMLAATHAFGAGRPDVVARILRDASTVDMSDLDQVRSDFLTEALNADVSANSAMVRRLADGAGTAWRHGDNGLSLNTLLAASLRLWWADSGAEDRNRVMTALERIGCAVTDARYVAAMAIAEPVRRNSDVQAILASVRFETVDDGDALRMYGMAAYGAGDLVLATDLLDRAEQSFREQGRLGLLPVVLALQLQIRIDLGDWAGAASASVEVNRLSVETGQPVYATNNVLVEARGVALKGDWRNALAMMEEAEAEAHRLGVDDRICLAYQARGAALLAADRSAEAFDCLKRQYDPADPGYHLRESFGAVALLAEAAARSGRRGEARSIVSSLESVALFTQSPVLDVNLLYARAVLAHHSEQEAQFIAALQADLTRWPWVLSRINLEYGRWIAKGPNPAAACPFLEEADVVFRAIGARSWSQRAREALEFARAATRGTGRTGAAVHE